MGMEEDIAKLLGQSGMNAKPDTIAVMTRAMQDAKKAVEEALPLAGTIDKNVMTTMLTIKLFDEYSRPEIPALTAYPAIAALKPLDRICPYLFGLAIIDLQPTGFCKVTDYKCDLLRAAMSLGRSYTNCLTYAVRRQLDSDASKPEGE